MLRQQMWKVILATSTAVDQRVARVAAGVSAPSDAAAAPARTRPPRLETAWRGLEPDLSEGGGGLRVIERAPELDRGGLGELQQGVRVELEALWQQLEPVPGFAAIRKALLIYFDERVMAALPDYRRLSWPLLQTEYTQSTAGGDDFYRFIDAALDDANTPSQVFEVDYFCLRHGFRGRYGEDLAKIAAYEQRLRQRIDLPPPTVGASEAAAAEQPPRAWPVWLYYVIALLFVVGFCVLMTALTNLRDDEPDEQLQRYGRRFS